MFSSLDISTSALVAQRARMNAISSNLANLSTTHNEAGQASQPAAVRGLPGGGQREQWGRRGPRERGPDRPRAEPRWKYEPGHPDALKEGPHKGYVAYPGVDMMTEMTNAMEAARAYEANRARDGHHQRHAPAIVEDYRVINSVNPLAGSPIVPPPGLAQPAADADGLSFKDCLINSIQEVNSMQHAADQAVEKLATGGDVDPAEVLHAVQKANIAFQMLMQMRNKIVSAYQDIQNVRV